MTKHAAPKRTPRKPRAIAVKRVLRAVLFFLNCTFWDKTGLWRFLPMNHVSHRMCTWLEIGAYWGDLRELDDRNITDVWRDGIGRFK